jgi:hypothetical protein
MTERSACHDLGTEIEPQPTIPHARARAPLYIQSGYGLDALALLLAVAALVTALAKLLWVSAIVEV